MKDIYSCNIFFSYWWLCLIVIRQPQPGEEPLAVPSSLSIGFDLLFIEGSDGNGLLSRPGRNKPYHIRHVGLSVLAHTMGINWSPNTTDKSILVFPPELCSQSYGPPFDQQSIYGQWEGGTRLTVTQEWSQKEYREEKSIRKQLGAVGSWVGSIVKYSVHMLRGGL